MALDGNRWLHVPDRQPCIFDIDLCCESEMGRWVRVRRRLYKKAMVARSVANAHPAMRIGTQAKTLASEDVNTCFLKSREHLPRWLRERIAVLDIADVNMYVPDVGCRWSGDTGDGDNRWYTVIFGCEGEAP